MKKYIIIIFLITSISMLHAQTYVLDNTFGTSGVKFFQNNTFFPEKGLYANQNYYLSGYDRIVKIDYSGNFVTSFGTNGILYPNPSASGTYTINNIVQDGGYFYVYGVCNNSTTKDMFICKIDANGNFDASFGTNGKAVFNLGSSEYLYSVVIESSGKLFAVGSNYTGSVEKVLYFKVNTDGNLDTNFDITGYKTYQTGSNSWGAYITPYDNGYIIAGGATVNSVNKLFFLKVDSNGVPDETFGTLGFRLLDIPSQFVLRASSSNIFFQNKIYLLGYVGFLYAKIAVYDIATNTAAFKDGVYDNTCFSVYNDGLYLNGFYSCGGGQPNGCNNKFNLRRKDLNGDPDPSFQNNTAYQYSYPYSTDNASKLLIKDEFGNFLLAGYKKSDIGPNNPSPYNGFMMIRLTEGALATEEPVMSENNSIYPNPFFGEVHINTKSSIESVVLVDLSGRILIQPKYYNSGDVYTVDLSSLSQSGIYFLRITSTDGSVSEKKIIRQ